MDTVGKKVFLEWIDELETVDIPDQHDVVVHLENRLQQNIGERDHELEFLIKAKKELDYLHDFKKALESQLK